MICHIGRMLIVIGNMVKSSSTQ